MTTTADAVETSSLSMDDDGVFDITSISDDTAVVVPEARRGRPAMLTEEEARQLTTTIQHLTVQTWILLSEAHERKAWAALGYETWKDYVTIELKMSESRSFQILDTAKIMKAVAQAGVERVEAIEPPPARVVQKLKDDLPAVKRAVKSAVKKEISVEDALRDLAKKRTAEAREAALEVAPKKKTKVKAHVRGNAKVECPACHGAGTVTAHKADIITSFLE